MSKGQPNNASAHITVAANFRLGLPSARAIKISMTSIGIFSSRTSPLITFSILTIQ